jgi:hypothetical protein
VLVRRGAEERPPPEWEPLLPQVAGKPPELLVRDGLRAAAERGGWRLVVTPPERHPELGRSVARALPDARFVSFEAELLARLEPRFEELERASRFKAQRHKLTAEAEAVLEGLLEAHGGPGRCVVLGDTAVLGTCEALHLVRRLYDVVSAGGRGTWVVVVPGVLHDRQPLFQEDPRKPLFHLEGQVLPLAEEIPP